MPKTKGVRYWDNKLWKVFSRYIRLRDSLITTDGLRDEDGELVAECITCYARAPIKYMDAGHWISRDKKLVKYDEHNVHAQCKRCNKYHNGEPQMYEDRIVELYGPDERDRLRTAVYGSRKFYPHELETLYNHYKGEVARLEKGLGIIPL